MTKKRNFANLTQDEFKSLGLEQGDTVTFYSPSGVQTGTYLGSNGNLAQIMTSNGIANVSIDKIEQANKHIPGWGGGYPGGLLSGLLSQYGGSG
ncbi:Uncharacterised protein [Mycobacteroides abscessus subsp. abscessus]|nr:Uncharacterised protein [Mycobacteroides abscessus subsp. abscessus]